MTVVSISESLAPRVYVLMQRSYVNGFGALPADFETWWEGTRHDSEFEAELCFVAMAQAEPVGLAHCWNTGFLKDFVVGPGWQRRGIGTALLLTAFAAMSARGHGELALKVNADNALAQQLYHRLGFAMKPAIAGDAVS